MKLIKVSKPEYGDKWINFVSGKNWAQGPLFGYDLETTAVDPQTARMVQAAIVVDIPGQDEPIIHEWLIDPGVDIPLNATAVHGINTEMVQEKGMDSEFAIRGIIKVLTQLKNDYPDSPLVCVNAPYDITITDREMRRYTGFDLAIKNLPPIVDTLTCDRKLDPFRSGRRTLTATSAAYGIPINGAHQAKNDVICSIKLIRAMAKKYPDFGSCDLIALQEMQVNAHNDWADNFQDYKRMEDPEFTITRGWPIIERQN